MWSARGVANISKSVIIAARRNHLAYPGSVVQLTSKNGAIRPLATTRNPLDSFRDSVDRQTRAAEPVGRPWSIKELRRKSYEDLHKLWYVLYKERNMLLTEQQLSRRRQLIFPQPERTRKVQKSMAAIKTVLGERKRIKVAQHLQSQIEKEMATEADGEEYELDEDNYKKKP